MKKAKSIAGELTERTATHLDPGHVAVFEYSSEPEMEDLGGVTGDIQSSTWNGLTTTELPFGTVTVFNLATVFGENGVWLVDDGKSVASEYEEVYETYLQPLVERVVGERLSLSGFLVFLPFVADYLAAAHAAYWKFHCSVLPVGLLLFVSSSFARLAWFSGLGSSRVFDHHVSVVFSELSFQIVAFCPFYQCTGYCHSHGFCLSLYSTAVCVDLDCEVSVDFFSGDG